MDKDFNKLPLQFSSLVELLRCRAIQQPEQQIYTFLTTAEQQEQHLTYGQLDRQARAIAVLLRGCMVPGERALLLYPPSLEYVAAFFGCLYAGVVAIPAYPPNFNRPTPRLQAIIDNAQAKVIMSTTHILSQGARLFFHNPDLKTLKWLVTDSLIEDLENDWQETAVDNDTLAFLQYTSGSTGTPKGVMLTHRNLLHNLALIHEFFEHSSQSQGVIWLPPYHDMGLIGGVLQPLYGGFPVTLMSPMSFLQSPFRWLQAISHYKGTTSGGPNFAYDLCVRKISPEQRQTLDLSSWEVAFTGAEPIRSETLKQFAETFAPCGFRSEAFYPCYGLAEATLIVSGGKKAAVVVEAKFQGAALETNRVCVASEEDQNGQRLIGCGRPALNQKVVIVNPKSYVQCQPDEIGEIWVSGSSVAQGYWNRLSDTKQTFQAYLADTAEGLFLRTGDLGFIHNKELFITGRLKDLIIIRGRNHYPHDIELTVENCHTALRPCSGAAFSVEVNGQERLVIAQEVERHYRNLNVDEIVANIRQTVAENHELQVYAVLLLKTGSIPKTSSGKIQRHACRQGFLQGTLDVIYSNVLQQSEVTDDVEKLTCAELFALKPESRQPLLISYLRKQVAQLLQVGLTEVNVQQPLTALGLDSLMTIELKNHLEINFDMVLAITQLLQGPSLEELATVILDQLTAPATFLKTSLIPVPSDNTEYPLSYGQRSLWFLHQLAPDSPAYNIIRAVRICSKLDISALHRTLQILVNRHPSLRTTFHATHGEPVQHIHTKLAIDLQQEDASLWSETFLSERLLEEAYRPFNLELGPLLRVSLFTRSPREHILLLAIHHIISDFWSLAVLVNQLNTIYQAEIANSPVTLTPTPALQYTDYVNWQAQMLGSSEGERLWAYWQKQLAGELPVLNLPTDRPPLPVQTYRGASYTLKLNEVLTQKIKTFSRTYQTTLYVTLLAAFQVLLYRYTGQEDILVGSPTVGRNRAELAGLVGYFVNPVVLRANLSQNLTFKEFLDQVRQTVLKAFEHQDYPFSLLVERLQPKRDLSHSPLFQAMFVLQKAHLLNEQGLTGFALGETGAKMNLGELELQSLALEQKIAQFDLTLMMAEVEEGLTASFEYNADLFDAPIITRMANNFQTLLESIVADSKQSLSCLPLLTEVERQTLLIDWNATQTDDSQNHCIHELFEAQVQRTPNAIAVVFENEQLTYRELNSRANQLAHHLQSLGVGLEVFVGICMERSLDLVVGLLGILKAGGAYVPLDPVYPQERLAFILKDANVPVLLTQQRLVKNLPEHTAKEICLDSNWANFAAESVSNLTKCVTFDNLGYVIYTSGSTGRPKGVAIQHQSAVTLLNWARTVFAPEDWRGVLASTSICFDLSVFELFVPLSWGGKVILAENALHLPTLPAFNDVTLINTVPSAIAELLRIDGIPTSVQTINLAGEPLQNLLVQQLYKQDTIQQVFNLYGPSEDTTYSTFSLVKKGPSKSPSIGYPISNTQAYILDSHLQPVPVGVVGEIYLGGDGLARGYLNCPDLTAAKFIPNPFSHKPGARLYKTGDTACYLDDGNIQFLDRIDYQVKIRGFRIELGEIEEVLYQHFAVQETVVIVREDVLGGKCLIAYVVPHPEQTLTVSTLRSFLKEKLPEYMVPASLVMLEALPRTLNGKVDRRALLALEIVPPELELAFVPPQTPIEEMLAGIWTEVLELKQVGIYDNFFELGGHSLLATQVKSRVSNTFQIDLPLSEFFEANTVHDLAERIETATLTKHGLKALPIKRVLQNENLPLSFAQQRLWFLDQLEPGNPFYNIPAAVRLTGPLQVVALEQSLNEIVKHHEILRTTFAVKQDQPIQIIIPTLTLMLPMMDLRQFSESEREAEIQRLATKEAQQSFNLERVPLLSTVLLQLDEEEYVLLLTMHHIISDGWSMGVLVKELTVLYEAFCTEKALLMPELPIQYIDFTYWQRQYWEAEIQSSLLTYWKQQLGGSLPVLELPTDRPRPAVQTFQGGRQSLVLPKSLTESLKALSQQEGVTLFMTLLAAFVTLLYRYTRQEDILVGTPIANRTRSELEGLIGFFANILVLRSNLSGNLSFQQLLSQIRKIALEAYTHQEMPFEKLVEELQPERSLSHTPLFQVMFAFQNAPMPALEFSGLTLSSVEIDTGTAKFDLTLDLSEEAEGIKGWLEYNTNLFDACTIHQMAGHFQTLLEGIVIHPEQQLAELALLSKIEQQQLLVEFNQNQLPIPNFNVQSQLCIHELLEAQVEQTPDDPAVVFKGKQLSYSDLNQRANQLAHHLQALGVEPEIKVGICVERSLEMIIGILAILKAGGAYLPLDPAYPVERLAFMLKDSRASILLTQNSLLANPPEHQAHIIYLDTDWEIIARQSIKNPIATVTPANLAYIIYTSGSTGQPKGVMIPHQSITNRLLWGIHYYKITSTDSILQKTSFGFDVSLWEIFGPLLAGGRLVMAKPGCHQDPAYLVQVIAQEQITLIDFVPAMLQLILEEPELHTCKALRYVTCGGEALSAEMRDRFFAHFDEVELHNCYGPTEVSIDATTWVCDRHSPVISIGRPIANQEVYILDTHLQPLPIGIPGELYVGGVGLARGYQNRPDLTGENFIPHPFSNEPGRHLYKTRDLARYSSDGNVQFLGRIDEQVKIRGFRVELGEIEAVLRQHLAVREAVVLLHENAPNDKRLVAYVVFDHEQAVNSKEMRQFLKEHLPEYMMPSSFVRLDSLPLTPNGKLDRQSLPAPDLTRSEHEETFVAPRNAVEEILAGIWAEILSVKQVGIYDNFFELGGHSLLATQVVSRIRNTFQVELPLHKFFEAVTVAQLSQVLISNEKKPGLTEKIAQTLKKINAMSAKDIRKMLDDKKSQKGEL